MTPLYLLAQESDSAVSLLSTVSKGGAVGVVIILLSIVALALAIAHAIHIRTSVLAPDALVDRLHGMLASGDLAGARKLCADPDEDCFLSRVMSAGFKRMTNSAFGSLELKGALEDAGKEQVARLYRTTDGLGLIAAIAPMLGLLGTVLGMVGAFNTLGSSTGGFAKPDELAGSIAVALITTVLGLVVAIPVPACLVFFRNRIDSISSDVSEMTEELLGVVESHQSNAQQRPAAPQPQQPARQPATVQTAPRP